MNRTLQLGSIIGLMVVLLLAIIYIFKPSTSTQINTAEPIVDNVPAMKTSEPNKTPSKQDNLTSEQNINQKELIQQREQLYKKFQDINTALSRGQQPDAGQISKMLEQQKQLVQSGIVPADEAISNAQFLKQILPVMQAQIHRHILQLEQLRHGAK